MRGLSGAQMRTYALAKGMSSIEADKMIEQIYNLEVEDLASRPKDLEDIIGFWVSAGCVGTRLDLIEQSFKNRVTESDGKRKDRDPLTIEKAQQGARKLAAAVTLQQVNRILVPGADPVTKGVDAEQILSDWSPLEINALLQRALFEEETYGTVRFYHRSVREYLTAEWLHDLLKNDKSRRDIEAIFFRNQYGLDVIVPTSRSVLSWMVLLDDQIREKTRAIAPEVFVKNGDVSRLPLNERMSLLGQLCDVLATKGLGRTYFTGPELFRFGKADMADHISKLMTQYHENDEVLKILLIMAARRELSVGEGVAISVAKDNSRESRTRVYALDYLQSLASKEALFKVRDVILDDENERDQRVLSQLIENQRIYDINPSQIASLLSRYKSKSDFKYDTSYPEMSKVLDNFSTDECFEFVEEVFPLLKKEPLIEGKYLDISQNYKWLYPPTLKVLEKLTETKDERLLDPRAMELLSFSFRLHDYRDIDDYKFCFKDNIPAFQALNDALLWYSIDKARLGGKEVRHFRQGYFWDHHWSFNANDFVRVLDWIDVRKVQDDKLVALSLAFVLYCEYGRGDKRRKQLWKAVKGNEVLHDQLHLFLHPKPASALDKKYKQSERHRELRRKKRAVEQAEILKDWQKYLASDEADQLLDVSGASEGRMWQGNSYLMDMARNKRNGTDKWASKNWRALIPAYGNRAAERYRDAAMSYWRHYNPTEDRNSSRHTYATIFGLTGLEIEAEHNPNWLSKLTIEEAHLVMQYANREMNGYPSWLGDLFYKFPKVVIENFCEDIEHEFKHRECDEQYFGVLQSITWRYPWLYCSLMPHLMDYLGKYKAKHQDTLLYALGIILQCSDLDKQALVALIKKNIKGDIDHDHKAIWYAVWINISAKEGFEAIKVFVEALDKKERTPFVMRWITMQLGDRDESLRSHYHDFKAVQILKDMYVFVYQYVCSSEDIDRVGTGSYSPNLRDYAQRARSAIFNILSEIPGRKTYDAFMEFSKDHPEENHRPWYIHHAKERAEKDADSTSWKASDFADFENSAKRQPQNHQEVFDLAHSRLLDLKDHLENGDDSQAKILINADKETLHRNYFAKEFRDKSMGFYSVSQEDELADAKRVDLRIHGSGLDCPVPIELKLAGNWTGDKHFERLENQLAGDYLRDMRSSRGIFLIVNRGKKKRWDTTDGKRRNFDQLISALQSYADNFLNDLPHIEEIQVIGIDLTKRATASN